MKPDIINSLFEFFGAIAVLFSIVSVLQTQQVAGVSWITVLFFSVWGAWNIYYYRHLKQWFSWVAGIGVTLANTTWVILLIYYG